MGIFSLIRANPKKHMNYINLDIGGDLLEPVPAKNELWYWIQQAFENYP